MRFLICDSDISYRSAFVMKLKTLIEVKFMIIEVEKAMRFESALSIDQRFISQVVIMDQNFSDDPLLTARLLIQNNRGLKIIWTGDKPLSSYEGLEPHIIGFIQKPIKDEQFITVIHKAIDDYNKRNIQFLCPIRKTHSYEKFWVNDIRIVYTYYNDLEITLCNGEKRECHVKSRYHLRNALGCRWFIRVNENVMVNMNEIDVLTDKICILKTHEVFKVSKTYSREIIKKYELFNKNKRNNYYIFDKDENRSVLKTSYPRPSSMF